jgi:hypothetical protein
MEHQETLDQEYQPQDDVKEPRTGYDELDVERETMPVYYYRHDQTPTDEGS